MCCSRTSRSGEDAPPCGGAVGVRGDARLDAASDQSENCRRVMKETYLEVTYRGGVPQAAYLYLPRRPGDRSVRTKRVEPGMVIDFNRVGTPIGIEITSPGRLTLPAINRVLRELGLPTLKRSDLAPLRAA